MEIKIDKNIPLPSANRGRQRKVQKYDEPLFSLEIGDSFQVTGKQECINLRNCVQYHRTHFDKDYATRSIPNAEYTIRVWRTK
jgi:hypothetical protein